MPRRFLSKNVYFAYYFVWIELTVDEDTEGKYWEQDSVCRGTAA
jgi:hypothetical protein